MNSFLFAVPQEIFFGKDSLKKLPDCVRSCGLKKVLIISGPVLNRIGVVDQAAAILEAAGLSCERFVDIEANPSVETVDNATAAYRESGAEGIIALGGGSPMDVAKAVGVLATYGGTITAYEGGGKVPGKIVPLIAIPTTAGTGSEVTAFSVITDRSRHYKLTVFSDALLPSHVILDPGLIASAPFGVAAATGIDALVHAVEAFLSKAASPFSDAMAEKAISMIGGNIRTFTADRSNEEAAAAMLAGSTFAGIAFNLARLGNVHAMAHPLGGFFDIAHGVANAILLPVVLEYNALADSGKYRVIFERLTGKQAGDFAPAMLVEAVRELTEALAIPPNLEAVGVDPEKIPEMAEDALKSGNILVNPRQSTRQDIEALYRKAMG